MQTIEDYITAARILLQDTLPAPAQRYSDDEFVLSLEMAFDEAFRIRPDMFVKMEEVSLVGKPLTTEVPVPRGYRSAFVYYMGGNVQLQDLEDTQDQRATIFLNKFVAQLMATAS